MILRAIAVVSCLSAMAVHGRAATAEKKWVSTVGMPLVEPRPTSAPPFQLMKVADRLAGYGVVALLHDLCSGDANRDQFAMIERIIDSRRDDEIVYALIANASAAVALDQPHRATGNDLVFETIAPVDSRPAAYVRFYRVVKAKDKLRIVVRHAGETVVPPAFTIYHGPGNVRFAVPASWELIGARRHEDGQVTAFYVPWATKETDHFANVGVDVHFIGWGEKLENAIAAIVSDKQPRATRPVAARNGEWRASTSTLEDAGISYEIADEFGYLAVGFGGTAGASPVLVHFRLAFPVVPEADADWIDKAVADCNTILGWLQSGEQQAPAVKLAWNGQHLVLTSEK